MPVCALLLLLAAHAGAREARPTQPFENILSKEEILWLKDHPVIKVAPDPDFPPIEWIDQEGGYRGLAADMIRKVEIILGVKFRVVNLKTWDRVLEAVKARQVDLLPAVSPSRQRRQYLIFTKPHLVLAGMIFMRKNAGKDYDLKKLRGKRITVVSGYVWQDYINNGYPDIALIPAKNVADGLKMVSFGQADAMIGDMATATYYLQKEGITNLQVAGETGYFTYSSFGARKDWPLLRSILEKAVAAIPGEENQAILDKWIRLEHEPLIGSRYFWIGVSIFLVTLVVLFLAVAAWNKSLRKLVNAKTAELSLELHERSKAENLLRESEEKFRSISANALDGIVMIDPEGKISFWNRAAEEIFGYTSQEALGSDLHMLLAPGKYRQAYREAFDLFVHTGKGQALGKTLEFSALRKDGSEFPMELSVASMRLRGKWNAVGVVRDISDRKRDEAERRKLETQLRQSQKMQAIGTLAGGLAHDFNNILTAVIGYGELALFVREDREEFADNVEKILSAAQRARGLVGKLLTFSRKAEVDFKPLNLDRRIDMALDILKGTIPKMINIQTGFSDQAKIINADAGQIEQVVLNLGINAADAMPEGGRMRFETEVVDFGRDYLPKPPDLASGLHALLRVIDNGKGMDQNTVDHIFEPFFTTKELGKGTGLGLSIVFGIVKAHQGHITCTSHPGEGTVFTIYFPLLDQGESRPEDRPQSGRESYKGSECILVVDDEEAIRDMTRQLLSENGYKPLFASCGEEALEIYRDRGGEISLVVLDIGMPGMGGHACLKEMRKLDPKVRILVASGYSHKESIGNIMAEGAKDFINKPYRTKHFMQAIRRILDQ